MSELESDLVVPGPGRVSEPSQPSLYARQYQRVKASDPLIDIVLGRYAASVLAARLGVPVGVLVPVLRERCVSQWGRQVLMVESQRHLILLDMQLKRALIGHAKDMD